MVCEDTPFTAYTQLKLQISRLIYYTSARIRNVIYTRQLVCASLRAAIVQSSKVSDSYKGNVNVGKGSNVEKTWDTRSRRIVISLVFRIFIIITVL